MTPPTVSAEGGWVFTVGSGQNALATNVALMVTQAPGVPAVVFVEVTQQFCDTAAHREIINIYQANSDAVDGDFFVQPGDTGAYLNSVVTLQSTRQTYAGCASAPHGPVTTKREPAVQDTISAAWVSDGRFRISGPGVQTRSAQAIGVLGAGTAGPTGENLALVTASISRTHNGS